MANAYKCDICGKYTDKDLPFTISHPKHAIGSNYQSETECCSAACAKAVIDIFVAGEEQRRRWAEESERRQEAYAAFEAAQAATTLDLKPEGMPAVLSNYETMIQTARDMAPKLIVDQGQADA